MIFTPMNCSFKIRFWLFQQFHIIISWESYKRRIKFCISIIKFLHLYNIAINFLIFLKNLHCILLNYTSTSKHLCLLPLNIIYITYIVSKWLKYYSFISFISSLCSIIISFSSNCYSSSSKYLYFTIIT